MAWEDEMWVVGSEVGGEVEVVGLLKGVKSGRRRVWRAGRMRW